MYGSDWPVCQVAATYNQVKGIVDEYAQQFSKDEQKLIFGGNAVSFYNL
jgi:L-fuconolactonase